MKKGAEEHRSFTDSLQINHFEEISQCPADLSFESISYSHFLEVIDGSILRNIFWIYSSKMKCFFKKINSLRVKKSTKHHVKSLLFESFDLLSFYINSDLTSSSTNLELLASQLL